MNKPTNKPFSTRLPDDIRAELQSLAKTKGITESDLGRMFIVEKLREASGAVQEARTLAALTIAALSDTIDLDVANELVEQHLAAKGPVTP